MNRQGMSNNGWFASRPRLQLASKFHTLPEKLSRFAFHGGSLVMISPALGASKGSAFPCDRRGQPAARNGQANGLFGCKRIDATVVHPRTGRPPPVKGGAR